MKSLIAILVLCAASLTCRADTLVDYTETVTNAPGGIGDFSWTVQTDRFIQPPPTPVYVNHQCINCDANLFTPIESVAPSNGDGCQITGVWMFPDFGPAPTTEFSPSCDGFTAFSGGVLPDVGTLGTWNWQWENPDNSTNYITLSITDPPAVPTPEPRTLELLACGLGISWLGWRRLGRIGTA